MKRAVLLLGPLAALILGVSCGGGGNSVTTPSGSATVTAPSKLKNRAFITNQYSGNVQIVNSQNDTTAYYNITNNYTGNSTTATSTNGGTPATAVDIVIGGSLTLMTLRPDGVETAVFNPTSNIVSFITNSSESLNASVNISARTGQLLYSPDSTKLYIPVPTAPVATGTQSNGTTIYGRPGVVYVVTEGTSTTATAISAIVPVPSAQSVAITPDGNTLLVFCANSDTMYTIDLTASTLVPVAYTGFARPVNAFFGSDSSTAYIINCGPECGATSGPPSVMRFSMASKTVTATVPVAGASVGLLKSSTLYLAGYPGGSTGTFDVVDIGTMTRTTTNPIAIGDGTHTSMAISNNNKMYIGAVTCLNRTVGCLSIVDIGKMAADPMGAPLGFVTGVQSIPNRDTMYVIEGGVLNIYNTDTGQLQSLQIAFRGALYGVLQIDQ